MSVDIPKDAAAPPSPGLNGGRETAVKESMPGYKTVSTWRKIGEVTRFHLGVRFSFTDLFGMYHLLYICGRDLTRLIYDQSTVDLVSVDEASNKIVVNIEGRAFRSRSRKALCLRVPCFAGGEAVVPWKAFIAVVDEKEHHARISVLVDGKTNEVSK